jgi:hypothetical protein
MALPLRFAAVWASIAISVLTSVSQWEVELVTASVLALPSASA